MAGSHFFQRERLALIVPGELDAKPVSDFERMLQFDMAAFGGRSPDPPRKRPDVAAWDGAMASVASRQGKNRWFSVSPKSLRSSLRLLLPQLPDRSHRRRATVGTREPPERRIRAPFIRPSIFKAARGMRRMRPMSEAVSRSVGERTSPCVSGRIPPSARLNASAAKASFAPQKTGHEAEPGNGKA